MDRLRLLKQNANIKEWRQLQSLLIIKPSIENAQTNHKHCFSANTKAHRMHKHHGRHELTYYPPHVLRLSSNTHMVNGNIKPIPGLRPGDSLSPWYHTPVLYIRQLSPTQEPNNHTNAWNQSNTFVVLRYCWKNGR